MSDLNKILAKNLESILSDLERRPAWLSERSGIAKSQIGRILSGDSGTTGETIEKLANALEMEPWELLRPQIPKPKPEILKERVLFQAAHPDTTEPTPIKPSAALSPLCSKAPTVDDVAAMVTRFAKVSPARRSVALAILFDDASLAPEVEAFLALYDSKHPREA